MLTFKRLVDQVSKRTGYPRAEAGAICQEFLDVLLDELLAGKDVGIQRLGLFFWETLKERQITHPKTKKKITAQERLRLKFRPGLDLRKGLVKIANGDETTDP